MRIETSHNGSIVAVEAEPHPGGPKCERGHGIRIAIACHDSDPFDSYAYAYLTEDEGLKLVDDILDALEEPTPDPQAELKPDSTYRLFIT